MFLAEQKTGSRWTALSHPDAERRLNGVCRPPHRAAVGSVAADCFCPISELARMCGSPQPPLGGGLLSLIARPSARLRAEPAIACPNGDGASHRRAAASPREGPHIASLRKLLPDKSCESAAACSQRCRMARRCRRRRAEASPREGPLCNRRVPSQAAVRMKANRTVNRT